MIVVVTGATGNVGTALLRALDADDTIEEVRAVARREAAVAGAKTIVRAVDLASDDLSALLHGADALVHLAWRFHPTHHPLETWRNNVIGTERLIGALHAAEVPVLVHASSVGAYSPAYGAEVEESWPTDGLPTAGYSREKAYCERLLDALEASDSSIRVVRLRPAFVLQRAAASAQRRIFAGPLAPTSLLRPGLLPALLYPAGLRFQVVHAGDVSEAVRLALVRDVRGAFNLAAAPVLDHTHVAELLGTRPVLVSPALVRAALALAWHARLAPAEPALFDLARALPMLRTDRAARELAWEPRRDAVSTLDEALTGVREGGSGATPPLRPDDPLARLGALLRGVGEHE